MRLRSNVFKRTTPEIIMARTMTEAIARAESQEFGCPNWEVHARKSQQVPPLDEWFILLFYTGRGWGKTWSCSGILTHGIIKGWIKRPALIGPTAGGVRGIMIEGDSGVLAAADAMGIGCEWNPSLRKITWEGGVFAKTYSAEKPGQLRGPEHDFAWCDEIREWKRGDETWSNMMLGLRVGDPHVIASTTPLPLPWIKKIREGADIVVRTGSTMENIDNLAGRYRRSVVEPLMGTRLGRQEILGEDLEDVEGALWTLEMLQNARVPGLPQVAKPIVGTNDMIEVDDLVRVGVSVDPAGTSNKASNLTGIVGGSLCGDRRVYVTHDWTCRKRPEGWARQAVALYDQIEADFLVVEVNHGGELVRRNIEALGDDADHVKIIEVRASKGKHVRAEPIATRYEKDRVKHVGEFADLENEQILMTDRGWLGPSNESPDRLDALVWLATELFATADRGEWEAF